MLTLFNRYHNGDIFYSRPIVDKLISRGIKVKYLHGCRREILEDLPVEQGGLPHSSLIENLSENVVDTWIGKRPGVFTSQGCFFGGHTALSKSILNHYNIEYNELDFLPTVRFNNLKENFIERIQVLAASLKSSYRKIVLICNNHCLSGQSQNFSFDPIISKLITKQEDVAFIVTNPTSCSNKNLIKFYEIIDDISCDLLYLSYFSTHADVIVGRASGPHCFTHLKENLLDGKKTYISITNNYNEGVWYPDSIANQVWSNDYNLSSVFKLIDIEVGKCYD